MPSNIMFAPIPSAFAITESFAKIAAEVAPTYAVELHVTANVAGLAFSVRGTGNLISETAEVKNYLGRVRDRPYLYCVTAVLHVMIQGQGVRVVFSENTNQTGMSGFHFEQQGNQDIALAVAEGLHKYLHATSKAAIIGAGLPEAEREHIRYKEQTVSDLQANVEKLGSFLLEQTKQQSELMKKLTTDLETKFQEREKTLADKFQKEQNALAAERGAFEAEKKAFDDRDRTHVRRDLLDKIKAIISDHKQSTAISESTANKRWIIHVICVAIMIASGTLAGTSAYYVLHGTGFDWRLEAPLLSGTIICASTAIYYLRWTNGWFAELARGEIHNRKFEADILRASWLAEMVFEYKKDNKVSLPPVLLKSLSKNLFREGDAQAQDYHPADQLFGLLKGVGAVKFGKDGMEISRK